MHAPPPTSIDLGEGPHPHSPAEVDVPGDRRCAYVVPVLVVGGQLLGLARLDVVDVTGQLCLRAPAGDKEGEGRGGE